MVIGIFIYHFIFIIVLYLAYYSERIIVIYQYKISSILVLISLIILVFFSGFRYYVGTDFGSYVEYFNGNYVQKVEYGFDLLNKVFINYDNGYQYVILTTSFFTYFFLFRFLKREGIFFMGMLVFLLLFYSLTNTLIRQGLAISIFLFSTKYIIEKDFFGFLKYVLLASLFHLSVLILIPTYFLASRSFRKKTIITLLILFIIISFFATNIINFTLKFAMLIPKYGAYLSSEFVESRNNTGLGVITKVFIGIVMLWNYETLLANRRNNLFLNLFFIGMLLTIIASRIAIVGRIAYYFNFSGAFIIAFYLNQLNFNHLKIKEFFSIILLLFFSIALFEVEFFNNANRVLPYQNFIFLK